MFLSITDKHVTNKAFILLHTQPAPYTAAAKRPLRERSDSSGLVRCTLYTTEYLRKWVQAPPAYSGSSMTKISEPEAAMTRLSVIMPRMAVTFTGSE